MHARPVISLLGSALATSWIAAATPAAGAPAFGALPAGPVQVDGNPLGIAALVDGDQVDVVLLRGRAVERFRLEGRRLVRVGGFQAPVASARPLRVDASRGTGGEALVTAVFGEDVRSVDQGADTRLHGFVFAADASGALRAVSGDLRAWLRLHGGESYVQARGPGTLSSGPVHRVVPTAGRYAQGDAVPWGGRSLLDATPLGVRASALAWDGDRPVVVNLESGDRVPGGSLLTDLGTVREPTVAVRSERELLKGLDREGRLKDAWRPLPRRVLVAAGAAYTVRRGRSRRPFGKPSGQDSVVRLAWSGDALLESRPYAGVEAFVLDFALLEREGAAPVALLLVNDEEDGSGRTHLLFQDAAGGPTR